MKKSLLIIAFICFLSIVTIAQDEYNKGEIYAGYSGATSFFEEDLVEHGFNASGVYNFHKYVGAKVDVSGTYTEFTGLYYFPNSPNTRTQWKARHNLYNVSGGVQFKDNRTDTRFKPFGHVLVGYVNHFDTVKTGCPTGAVCPPINYDSTGMSLTVGGGLDIKVNKRIDIRAGQFDINAIFTDRSRWVNTRFGAGIVFKF
ncbi:MAG: porin family protein [Pyrinomonadaceae bacterium]|nr:porin family protein [Pyrinomonadaceae bacterium]